MDISDRQDGPRPYLVGPVSEFVVRFVGSDGRRCTVTFRRQGQGGEVFDGRTDQEALNHAMAAAMARVAAHPAYGADWILSYKLIPVYQEEITGEPRSVAQDAWTRTAVHLGEARDV